MDQSAEISLCSLFDNITIDSLLDIRNKIRQHDGAYRRGDDIIILSHSVRTVRGTLKYTFLDGNPPSFSNFSLYGLDIEEDDAGKSYFLLDGTTPYTLSLLEAQYVLKLMEPEFMPSLYFSHQRGDFFLLNVDGAEKNLFSIPFIVQYIDSNGLLDYVIHYTPIDRDGWCEPITQHQAQVICRIFSITPSELCPYIR
uniref:Uncharacterized protein n=1 Tax=viral metagenome TaxID=1070528 RepID=A0A6C0D254_9ZZZZ